MQRIYVPRETQVPIYDHNTALRHVTVCQLLKAERVHSTALFKIEDKEFKKVILLGNIRLVRYSSTHIDYELDDGSGIIIVRNWVNYGTHETLPQTDSWPYARVIGELEFWNDKKTVKVTKIELTSSPYEPYHHMLCVIHDTVSYGRGPPVEYQQAMSESEHPQWTEDLTGHSTSQMDLPYSPPPTQNFKATDGSALSSSSSGRGLVAVPQRHPHPIGGDLGSTQAQYSTSSPPPFSSAHANSQELGVCNLYSHLPSLDYDILLCIKSIKEDNIDSSDPWKGVRLPTIVSAVCASRFSLTVEEFTESLERLIDEGFVFSTIDDDHYDITHSYK